MSVKEILDILSQAGVLGFCALALWAFFTRRIVTKGELDEQREDKKDAIEVSKDQTKIVERLAAGIETTNRLEEQRLALERDRGMR